MKDPITEIAGRVHGLAYGLCDMCGATAHCKMVDPIGDDPHNELMWWAMCPECYSKWLAEEMAEEMMEETR